MFTDHLSLGRVETVEVRNSDLKSLCHRLAYLREGLTVSPAEVYIVYLGLVGSFLV